jgi:hypothetical protein
MKKTEVLLLCILLLAYSVSCRKNNTYDLRPNVNVANDVILSISAFSHVFNLLIRARLDSSVVHTGSGYIDGAAVRYDSSERKYYFEFNGLVYPDNVERSGNLEVKVSGDILQSGSYATVVFRDYYEDGGKVSANDSIHNNGINSQGQVVFSDYITSGSMFKYYGGGTIQVKISTLYKTVPASFAGDRDILFLVRGGISGHSSGGYSFTAPIRDSLTDALTCPWIEGGIIDIRISGVQVPEGTIDFVSSDGCSDTLCYYFNGNAYKVLKNALNLKN